MSEGQENIARIARQVRLQAFASVAITEAYDPYQAQQRSLYLGFAHTPVTRERVAQVLGADAATAWDAMREAAAAFAAATDRACETQGDEA